MFLLCDSNSIKQEAIFLQLAFRNAFFTSSKLFFLFHDFSCLYQSKAKSKHKQLYSSLSSQGQQYLGQQTDEGV